MAIYLISVGGSILNFVRNPSSRLDDAVADRVALAAGEIGDLANAPSSEHVSATLSHWLSEEGAAEAAALCERLAPGQWPSGASAELSTFEKAGRLRARLTRGSTAVLITSDTPVGLVSSLLNALALTGGDPARVRYLPDLPDSFAGLKGTVVIARVPGLDTSHSDGFRAAMAYLGHLGRGLLAAHGLLREGRTGEHFELDENIRFYLSGGFKATIPYLIGLAEGMRSLTKAAVSACVLFEATSRTIDLPLRRLPHGVVLKELERFSAGNVTDRQPYSDVLEGYAYERADDGTGWELTPFGAGLQALYGMRNEAQ
ncbi:hypothetical protein [Actinomadura algeriensis]|uniref:CRISPR system ring nuclease SSO1393-like domain-containing protein n=1 Tax=Actinomadura algeriensis TaxID=1679523 RepID=A0ABR9JV24_9ACTN|nr:hypothetical protein [Actinomadura algeriensis]MBE1533955.1 hypothetical protein [Actinomadura algeriensis]